ncbi:MAG: STAS domain-containing protein, partial [Firmicutes bacterium]|nr:STAS domain-containing protein [Bacillota bacterium]
MYVTKTDSNTIQISGRIDTTNAKEFEEKLLEAIKDTDGDLSIDASELEYVSSAGLRVFLKVKKAVKTDVNVINVTPEVYDIFEVTGFNSLLNVSKKIREVSIEGCEVLGEGANGKVYRLDDETII